MEETTTVKESTEPLVEIAPEEAVVRALAQSAHPVEFIESNQSDEESD